MTPDPDRQPERQLWAAYRLILSWPKHETTQHEAQQTDHARDNEPKHDKPQQVGTKNDAA